MLVNKRCSNIIYLQFQKVALQSLEMRLVNTGADAREVFHKLVGNCRVISAPVRIHDNQ